MIDRLRNRFILITMSLLSLVLLVVFAVILISSYQSNKNDSMRAMQLVIERRLDDGLSMKPELGGHRVPEEGKSGSFTPAFCVLVDPLGAVIYTIQDNSYVSDDTLAEVVPEILSRGEDTGVVREYQLRYLRRVTPEGIKIAFSDLSAELYRLRRLALTSLAIGVPALVALYFISRFLSDVALRPVRKSWDQQNQFVADASHELKTPLTIILANTEILLSHSSDRISAQKKWVDSTNAEATRMKRLVEDLLYLAKSDASRSSIELKDINLSDLLWSCILPFESLAFDRGVSINSDVASNVVISSDESKLRQLVSILLDNAVKYAGADGVVSVSLTRSSDTALLKVRNTGEPIPESDLENIFKRFYRSDKSRGRDTGGFGLGLSIASSIVEGFSGKIYAASTTKDGTTFTVELPSKKRAGKTA